MVGAVGVDEVDARILVSAFAPELDDEPRPVLDWRLTALMP